MPGNEKQVVEFLITNKNSIELPHLGVLTSVKNPSANGSLVELDSAEDVREDNSSKKADIFLNEIGVSIKQAGSSFLYNRLQRDNLATLFRSMGFSDEEGALVRMDQLVSNYHAGVTPDRDRPWKEAFAEKDFKSLLRFLMMEGSPNIGKSGFPAELVLTAPTRNISKDNIKVFTFDEFFEFHEKNIFVTLRRQWVGQSSRSEHGRAVSLARKPGNKPWVFSEISGIPSSGWRSTSEIPIEDRREVYMVFIQLIK
jgi:hypothetical protein